MDKFDVRTTRIQRALKGRKHPQLGQILLRSRKKGRAAWARHLESGLASWRDACQTLDLVWTLTGMEIDRRLGRL